MQSVFSNARGWQALFLAIVCTASLAQGQLSWSGIYEFDIRRGGGDSTPALNDVPNSYLQLNVGRLQLFLDGAVSDDVSFSAKLSAGSRLTKSPFQLNLELAFVTVSNIVDEAVNISAGKILTPFGVYPRRQLSPDNPLIGDPLYFRYPTSISPQWGYLDSITTSLAGQEYGGRLGTMYRGGYYVGIELFGSVVDGLVRYDVAVMNAPLSAPGSPENVDKQLAVHGRIAVRPQIWGEVGFSYALGSFIERGPVNSVVDANGGTERFKQQTMGVDLSLSMLYYELVVEYIVNRFNAPYIVYDFLVNPPYRSGLTDSDDLKLSSRELVVDLKIDAPFYPGLYVAGRYDILRFNSIKDPFTGSSTFGRNIPWDRDVDVVAAAVGFKPTPGVLIKAGHEWITVNRTPRPSLNWLGMQVSVTL